jgi:ComF family protein
LLRWGDAVIRYALPPRCPGCGAVTPDDHSFCLTCWSALDFLEGSACACCGEPFELDPGPGALCGACHAEPPPIAGMRAAVAYGPIARKLALRLKYARRPGIARTMARHMRRHVPDDPAVLIAPVPLHRWRIWRRGYNQAALMARAIGRATGAEVVLDLIERHRATPSLRGLGPSQRARTVRGAFTAKPGVALKGRRIVLIDDVYTTGATVNACARALRRAGAESVSVLCWARVVRNEDAVR